jgi:hypothetical protein
MQKFMAAAEVRGVHECGFTNRSSHLLTRYTGVHIYPSPRSARSQVGVHAYCIDKQEFLAAPMSVGLEQGIYTSCLGQQQF